MRSLRPASLLATATIAAGLAAATAVLPVPAASAHESHRHGHDGHAVFVQNDDPAGNTVIAYHRSSSGRLEETGRYPTGGRGGVLAGSVVDHLASEGSLGYDDGLLVAVNAGSDTITTFAVDGDRLVRRQVLPAGGSFPVSVALHGSRVFVLDARDGGAVQGYLRIGDRLLPVPSWHRDLGLDPAQTPEFTSTPGQVGFTPDGRRLVVTTKNGSNAVLVYDVGVAGLSRTPTTTRLAGAVPFGFAFDQRGVLALTEAGTNAVATFRIAGDGHLVALDSAATGQAATCWAVVAGHRVYASNAGSGTLSSYRVGSQGSLTDAGLTSTNAGTVDAAASRDGRFLYVQTGAAGTIDGFRVRHDGSLQPIGSLTVPNGAGGEGIVVR
jgi:6-phosphogluconolactonase (cycloisomerase 2 family)